MAGNAACLRVVNLYGSFWANLRSLDVEEASITRQSDVVEGYDSTTYLT